MFLDVLMVGPMRFKISDILIELSFPLVAAVCIILTVDTTLTAFCAIINAILHESGHLLILRIYGCGVESIRIGLLDVNIKKSECMLSVNKEIFVALAGPATNLFCALLFYLLYTFTSLKVFSTLSFSALFLACFNILPVESLDGGNALLLFMLKRLDGKTAIIILTVISAVILVPMVTFGFLLLLRSKYNFTLLFTSCYLIGIILLRQHRTIHD